MTEAALERKTEFLCDRVRREQEGKVGLVLAGGGARGAFHVGALEYLAQVDFQPQYLAGASIGALNGAVVSGSESLSAAVRALRNLWEKLSLARHRLIKPRVSWGLHAAATTLQMRDLASSWSSLVFDELFGVEQSILDPEPIENLIRETISVAQLRRGTDLWVPLFQSSGFKTPLLSGLDVGIRKALRQSAHWLKIQDIVLDEAILDCLLAASAVPLVFPCRRLGGKTFVDGALADNVPIAALRQQRCTHAVVVHLESAALFDQHDYPEIQIVEIRPLVELRGKFPIIELFDFSPCRIQSLTEYGYLSAEKALKPFAVLHRTTRERRTLSQQLAESTKALLDESPTNT